MNYWYVYTYIYIYVCVFVGIIWSTKSRKHRDPHFETLEQRDLLHMSYVHVERFEPNASWFQASLV